MCKVFVLDTNKKPLDPIHQAQARQLLRNKKAAVTILDFGFWIGD